MGIVLKKTFNDECLLGIWEIKEDYDTLLSNLNLEEEEYIKLNGFKSEGRKREWLSVRNLINNLLERDARIIYNSDNKPFLKGTTYNISISHSYNLTAIFLSKTKRVGLDLEKMSHKIVKLSDKFVNPFLRIKVPQVNRTIDIGIIIKLKKKIFVMVTKC